MRKLSYLDGTFQNGRTIRGGGLFGCHHDSASYVSRGRTRPSLELLARHRISEEGVAVDDSKGIFPPFTTPVLGAYGSTLA